MLANLPASAAPPCEAEPVGFNAKVREERRVRKGATALESRKPTSAKDRLRRLRHGPGVMAVNKLRP